MRAVRSVAQAWIELRADDPEAVSALGVARAHLDDARALAGLRRFRLFELAGVLPGGAELEDRLHRSTRFYNPHKERCVVRTRAEERAPVAGGPALLVSERDLVRRPAAERWWKHDAGRTIEVREAVVWALVFDPDTGPTEAMAHAEGLAVVRDRRHGLFCNPHAQDWALSAEPPLPWLTPGTRARRPRARGEETR